MNAGIVQVDWLGGGASGHVYSWIEGRVIKVARDSEDQGKYEAEAKCQAAASKFASCSLKIAKVFGYWATVATMQEEIGVEIQGFDIEKNAAPLDCPVILMERLYPPLGKTKLVKVRLGEERTSSQYSMGWQELEDGSTISGTLGSFMRFLNVLVHHDGGDIETWLSAAGTSVLDFGECIPFVDDMETAKAWLSNRLVFPNPQHAQVWVPFATNYEHKNANKVLHYYKKRWEEFN